MKKPIHSSNLCLRFYVNDGWTQPELFACLVKGSIHVSYPHDKHPYFTLVPGSFFDCAKLLDKASYVVRAFDDHPQETDLQFLERMNG